MFSKDLELLNQSPIELLVAPLELSLLLPSPVLCAGNYWQGWEKENRKSPRRYTHMRTKVVSNIGRATRKTEENFLIPWRKIP